MIKTLKNSEDLQKIAEKILMKSNVKDYVNRYSKEPMATQLNMAIHIDPKTATKENKQIKQEKHY